MNNDDKDTAKKEIVSNKPELNEHMYNWIIAKYGKPNANWTDSLFDIIADDVYTTFFISQSMPNSAKTDVRDVAKIDVRNVAPTAVVKTDQDVLECSKKEDQQEVAATDVIEPYQEIIISDSNSSSSAELELPSSDEFEFSSSDELDSNSLTSDESDEFDSTSSSSLEKIVSNKGPSKKVKDEKHEEKDETYETDDKEEELWSSKTKGKTTKCLPTPKSKEKTLTTPKIQQTKKKFVVKSTVPIRRRSRSRRGKESWVFDHSVVVVIENDVENVKMDNQKDNCDGEFGNVNNISDEVNFSSGFNTYKKADGESMDSDHCRESEGSRKGGSILMLMDELVKVGQTMRYNMDGCMKNIEEIIESQGVDGVNFLTLQETKMESIDLFEIKRCWGNFAFDYVHSASVGKSGLDINLSKSKFIWVCGERKIGGAAENIIGSAELELPSSDEFDSLEKIVSNKGPSKKVKDEKHEEEDETYETNDKEEELWSPKTKGKTNQEKEQVRKGKRKLGV
ncbi:hypothetical protein Tco_0389596 [Tanacetum coccineum]